ncbi:glucose-1-phosphate thymidylyltransferase [Streptomyces himastatinicus ATCC 53653]|uniref:Glucose-1-phosphate thymidylyltransferase n=1 Tax=Streptomyces himastatinicus ATCC 53653 TaxID=457427 RepID=D9WEH6_9ACTN|nr:glucose-1-phosphate thymidylyltransferase [Streptomyces himastatinicus]EFL23215.1 glucose-1-phosphate thymidylyltransferase [Streptomyces himastatinicus ATCC 53653]
MKALVLSGGMGLRLRPFSHSMPKQLIPVANKPVLVHVVEGLRTLGITEVGVVVGDRAEMIEGVLGDGSDLDVKITYIPQDAPHGLAHCVAIARDFLGDDDFVMYLGDQMLPDGITELARDFRTERPDAQVVVHQVADPRAFGVAEVAADGRVVRLVEKPESPVSDLAVVGVYFFTAAIHQAVAAISAGHRGELEITDAIQWLVSSGADVRARVYRGFWKDTGRVDDVLECNRELLDRLKPSVRGDVDDASELIGAVVVEEGARIVRSRVVGPAVVGAGALVEDSDVGPHTAIGRDCVLSGTDVGYTIVQDGATVRNVASVRASVIGRDASVTSAPAGGGHRLVVGDHSRIEVAA